MQEFTSVAPRMQSGAEKGGESLSCCMGGTAARREDPGLSSLAAEMSFHPGLNERGCHPVTQDQGGC